MKNLLYRLLKRSERITQTDMIYVAKGGSWLFLGQIIAMISGLALSVAMANLLPKEVFGIYKFILSGAGIIASFSLTGMGTAISQAAVKGFDHALTEGFRAQMKWNIGMIIIAIASAGYYYLNENNTLAVSFVVIALATPLINSFSLYTSFLQGKKLFGVVTRYGFIRNIVPPLILIATITQTNNPVAIIVVYHLVYVIILGALYARTVSIHVDPNAPQTSIPLLTNSKHLTLINAVPLVAGYLDKILIFHYLGAAPLAIYSFAIAPVNQIRGLNKIIKTLVFPKLAENDIKTIKSVLPRKALLMLLVAVAITGTYILSAPLIYETFFPQYVDAVVYSQIAALTILFIPSSLLSRTFLAHMKKRELYMVNVIVPLMEIALLFLLLPSYGIGGAVTTLVAIQLIHTSFTLYYFVKLS